jgi:heme exporter protein A
MSLIEINCDDLSKTYSGRTIFKNLSFKISSTQSLTVTGSNGSGKSTLIKVLANLINSSKGNITVSSDSKEIPRDKWFLKTGLLSPYLNLYDELTGYENLDFFYKLKSSDKNNLKDRIDHILQRVNLYEKRNELLKNYSSGMKQKLKLAFSVLHEPEILLLDEPRSNLDKAGVDMIYEISNEQKKKGILIIATNDEDDKELCDRILSIEDYK